MGHRIQEVHTLTQSQGRAQHIHTLTLSPSAAHTLPLLQDHAHPLEEAEARSAMTLHGPDLMDITDLGQGPLPIEDITHGPDLLQKLGDSLLLNSMYLKEKKNSTRNGGGNTASGMRIGKGQERAAQPRAWANRVDFSPERLLPPNIRHSPFTRGHREERLCCWTKSKK